MQLYFTMSSNNSICQKEGDVCRVYISSTAQASLALTSLLCVLSWPAFLLCSCQSNWRCPTAVKQVEM